jgi:hypothetical protein
MPWSVTKNRIMLLQDDLRWYERRLPEILLEDFLRF